jgi:tetratricopeptide (TPR) repeat protein
MPRHAARTERDERAEPPPSTVHRLQGEVSNAAMARLLARAPDTAEAPITAPGMTGAAQWNERGAAHFKAGRLEAALEAFAAAYELNPLSTFLYDQAECLERLGRTAEAIAMYERYLAAGPLMADVAKARSRVRRLRGETVPEGEDDDAPPITATGPDGARAWFDRGQAQYLAGRYAYAAASFRKAFELLQLASFLYNEGSALEKGGHPAAAANAYEHYLLVDPAASDAQEVMAKIKRLRGRAPAAGPDSLLDPEDEAAEAPAITASGRKGAREWYGRGTLAYQLGDFKRAYDCFVQAYDLNPHADLVFNQASCLDQLGNADAAVQAYERYLALAPRARDGATVRRRIKLLREGGGIKTP